MHFIILFLFLLLQGCSSGNQSKANVFRIGVDEEWYPIDFGAQQDYVNGFVEDLLIEIANYSGIKFEKISVNWDVLLEGMHNKKYDAVLSSLPPYNFNLAKYDFSQNFLDLGPVLIVSTGAAHRKLKQMKGELVGVLTGDPAFLLFQGYPEVVVRYYPTIPDLLNALVAGEIQGGLLNQIPAVNYIQDLYAGKLAIASSPMTDAGLHLVALKGRKEFFVRAFDKNLAALKKKKKLQALLQKWQLSSS